ncbi:LutB/LldF family L-lactate oxidation iron-sulfur protein [Cognatazoarcus halotolerans]|uniref:LutB/LldF family L-lactate oxidation iron-sulfur protein n=1 Tax=Cognatazoarcus halotolerans TaxID=2686016 RepID=UPI00135C8DAF|nr:LutB/LldF family L-lactate oxidation iron-sulfur protein [Cognatazoarcus halotolerans]MCB1898179.1 iron-sulfur cluster-binding protein [Rhodocyclaceae bacterium]MCP5307812.1 iron-sulfur cluster-binding protein [Zoogloeaceae bacterium]
MSGVYQGTFKSRADEALHNPSLQKALKNFKPLFVAKRADAVAALEGFEQLRETAAAIKDAVLDNLDEWLERYASAVEAAGGHVHFASDAEEARNIILDICRKAEAKTICKGKSMVSEEIGLNEVLEEAGYKVVETDLGEYIIQLAHEPPSHIIAPAIHKTREQVADLFEANHPGRPREDTVAGLVGEARTVLREKFFQSDVGITGGNFLIAETGTSVIVTNEGNGDLTQTLSRVHIVTSGIERVLPTLDDLSVFLRLLARSATGQDTECYTTLSTGPRRPGDPDGPEEYHVVLVDNGRSKMLGGKFREMLRCIRCGACMNHCPVYGAVGGHAYGWVYPGPMGSILTPLFNGLAEHYDLPNACTLNGRCQSVCPVKIPLTELIRTLRSEQVKAGLMPASQRRMMGVWGWVARNPGLYHALERFGSRLLRARAGKSGRIASLPGAGAWTSVRDIPAPDGPTFLEKFQAMRGEK